MNGLDKATSSFLINKTTPFGRNYFKLLTNLGYGFKFYLFKRIKTSFDMIEKATCMFVDYSRSSKMCANYSLKKKTNMC